MRALIVTCLALCLTPTLACAEAVRLTNARLVPALASPNLVTNGGFESFVAGGFPVGWSWDRRNTNATCSVDLAAHGGHLAMMITNGTDEAPHVYGLLSATKPVELTPGKPCTLSVWVRSQHPGSMWIGGGRDWRIRLWLQPTGGVWKRFTRTFIPEESERRFTLLLGTDSPTDGTWIDDIKLEEGEEATPPDLPVSKQAGARIVPALTEIEADSDCPFTAPLYLIAPKPIRGRVDVALPGAKSPLSVPVSCAAGAWRLEVAGVAQGADYAPRTMRVRVTSGDRQVATAAVSVRLVSAAGVLRHMAAIRKQLPGFVRDLQRLRANGTETAYPTVTLTVLRYFTGYVEQDVEHGLLWRAAMQAPELDAMAVRLKTEIGRALAGKIDFPAVPRWTGTTRPVVSHSSFIGPVATPGTSGTEQRPVFFNGYGHFMQVRDDIEKFPGYGINAIQMEFGPNSVFPKEGVVNMAPVEEARRVLDRAQKAGVAVCLLISPHYMPDWVLAKYPELRKHRDGFLQYCLHAPESREILQRFVETAIAPLANHPALHSICLSNEPVNEEEPCAYAMADWHAWLATRHGDVATMNARWGSTFASFDDVPLPSPYDAAPPKPELLDYHRWNQDFFAGWHKMLADAVHKVAPNVPVHAKAMIWTIVNQGDLRWGVDATLFGRLSDINGNDASNEYNYDDSEYSEAWQTVSIGHDLQRSVLDAPIFNTENHIIRDRERRNVPPEHIRAALWQAAVQGQSAQTIWVWERTYDLKSDFAGSIMHHPACAEAVGVANYDMNRAALELTALQQAKPQALILHSLSGMEWEGSSYSQRMSALYQALTFLGVKVGFVTERQLEDGTALPRAVLFVPGKLYLSERAARALARFNSRVVYVGDGEPTAFDEYGREMRRPVMGGRLAFKPGFTSAKDLRRELIPNARRWNLIADACACDAKGLPLWGVASRSTVLDNRLIVNVCNYAKKPARVRIGTPRGQRAFTDVLTGERVTGAFTLKPLEVRLLVAE